MNKYLSIFVFLIIVVVGSLFVMNISNENQESSLVKDSATVSTLSVINENVENTTASAVLSLSKMVTWQTTNYPDKVGVNINLVKKVSDSPREFVLVRTIAKNTENDGKESLTLREEENTTDLYIEVTCGDVVDELKAGCSIPSDLIKIN